MMSREDQAAYFEYIDTFKEADREKREAVADRLREETGVVVQDLSWDGLKATVRNLGE